MNAGRGGGPGGSSQGGPPGQSPGNLSSEAQKALEGVAGQVRQILSLFYSETEHKKDMDNAAAASAAESPDLMQVVTNAGKPGTWWAIEIYKHSPIVSKDEMEAIATVAGPAHLGQAESLDDIISSMTVVAIATSPISRALAYMNGYVFKFRVAPPKGRGSEGGQKEDSQIYLGG